MEIYNSEQEQIEALKRWWDKNGSSVLIGLVLVLAAVFGWRTWQDHRNEQLVSASAQYQQLLGLLDSNPTAALEQGRKIVGEHPSSPYADFASLAMGAIAVEQGDWGAAEAHLRAVVDRAAVPELQLLARARLARVQLAQGKPDEALATLAKGDAASFQALFEEVRGDAYLAKGDRAKARAAYAAALAGYSSVPAKQSVLQMRLDDLVDVERTS